MTIITSGGADGVDDRSVGCRVGEVERRVLHRKDLDVGGHQTLAVRMRQAVKHTRCHLLDLAGLAADHHAGVPWSEAVSSEDEGGSSCQAAHIGAEGGLSTAAQGDRTGCKAFASHNHFDWVVASRQSVYSHRNVAISHRGDFQLCGAGKHRHVIHTAAKP